MYIHTYVQADPDRLLKENPRVEYVATSLHNFDFGGVQCHCGSPWAFIYINIKHEYAYVYTSIYI